MAKGQCYGRWAISPCTIVSSRRSGKPGLESQTRRRYVLKVLAGERLRADVEARDNNSSLTHLQISAVLSKPDTAAFVL